MAIKKETMTPQVAFGDCAEIARKFMKAGKNLMITGQPGIGKSALIALVAEQLKYDVITFHGVVADPTDLKGMPWLFVDTAGNNQAVFVPFDQLKDLINAKRPTICVLEDFGQSPVAVQASMMQLIWGGELCGKKISKHVRFIAATNRKQDRAGVSGVLEPIKSRFAAIVELVPDLDTWVAHASMNGVSPMLVAFMRHRPNWLTGGDEGWSPINDIANQACPRTISNLSDSINMNFEKELRPTVYAAAVGKAMANEFFAFEQLVVRMPDIDVILKNPMGAEIPSTPDICYAMIGALHSRMDRANLGNIYTYIARAFTKELQAVFHFDVAKFSAKLDHHEAYIKFAADNGDLFTN